MNAAAVKRRTQAERRAASIGRILDATIAALDVRGYAKTSTSEICKRAEISQGGLFRHFASRLDVIVAATEEVGKRHIERFENVLQSNNGEVSPIVTLDETNPMRGVVLFIRESTRSRIHHAWHEVMVAARTDEDLRERVSPILGQFESALLKTVYQFLGMEDREDDRLGVVLLSIMHMFDSESVTVSVYRSPELEAQRIEWATELLCNELMELQRPH